MFVLSLSSVLKLLLISLLLPCVQSLSTVNDNDNDNYEEYSDEPLDFEMLISGGFRPTKHTLAKYVVSIRTARHTAYFGDNHFCAGAIIAKKVIITAAHCVVDSNKVTTRAKRLKVVAGAPNRLRPDKNTVEMEVDSVVPHALFSRSGPHDIALLRLKQPIPVDNDAIKIISLAFKAPVTNANCTTIGWGQLFSDGPYAADAVYVHMTILKKELCKKKYKIFTEGMICAADPKDWDRDACRGDSGGPLICEGRLTGIVSYVGMNCADKGFPTIFSDIFYYRRWIQEVSGVVAAAQTSVVIVGLGVTLIYIF